MKKCVERKVLLMILDGWGIGDGSEADVIAHADTPNMDVLTGRYLHSRLLTSGENVGLPEGQMGNSEVGHLNIGAGRVVYQDLVRINLAIRNRSIEKNEELVKAFKYARDKKKSVHFIGLLSDGGVHSMDTHLYKLCDMTGDYGLEKVYIHALTDGRDTDPKSGKGYLADLLKHLKNSNGVVASLIGRYYTMDRDKRWERIKQGYDLMVHGKGKPTTDILQAIQESYDEGVTDEFIKPIVCTDRGGNPLGTIQEGDVVICFNFRTDRLREITIALTQKDFPEYDMHTIPLYYLTMTRYDDTFKNVRIIYEKQNVKNTLGEVVSREGLKQLRIAETEKYAHVTFFFSGGQETEFEGEKRIMIPSPKVATYDLKPEMSAYEVTDALVKELTNREHDFICLNFANGDMVGHTGVYEAIRKAIEAVDECVGKVVKTALENGYTPIIIADHGNADNAVNQDGSPNTAHSLNPVPCIVVSDDFSSVNDGILADVAPTILHLMGLKKPSEMTGKVLVS
ncbi:MAG TPA: 2,3-bisphosphoglycerate-independent phosphoglycerate mutase [Bacteroidetes bacterium]|nr:2,3-bisphosphoglycerate-independent phosphoglycerate mutase [Bacteroidota bacterium]